MEASGENIVVGSGPAGVACAMALLERGATVRMVDVGLKLESEREELVRGMSATSPAEWDPQNVAAIRHGMEPSAKGVVLKRIYGSDYPYRKAVAHLGLSSEGVALQPSFALGGLSNVWGAAMLPYPARDLAADWPVSADDLAPHYRAVLRFTGYSARRDGLAEMLPLHAESWTELKMSSQSRAFWEQLERRRAPLEKAGIRFGSSRLAVRGQRDAAEGEGCVYSGLCMYGCPYGFIYSSAQTVAEMRANPRFSYEPGVVVERVEERGGRVHLLGERRGDAPWRTETGRVFLAAGVIPTSRILLASREVFDTALTIRDSQYFLFPLLFARRARGLMHEPLHTLSQIFLEMDDPRVSPHLVHMQLYSYNDLVAGAVRHAFKSLAPEWLIGALVERMMIVQAYLHSDHSSRMRIELSRNGGTPELRMRPELNPDTPRMVRAVLRKMLAQARHLGALPVAPMLHLTEPGRGFHSGGSWPMRKNPGPLECDTLGRPPGWSRIHAVDATVFPTIPSTTITLSAMANAHRIGAAAASL